MTARELEVMEALAKGLSYKEVARLVGASYDTVADHVKTIYRKLAVNSRGEAVFEAVQAGLIQPRDGAGGAGRPARSRDARRPVSAP